MYDRKLERLRKNVEYLPREYRKVWTLHFVNGFSAEEIASILGVKIETIKRIISESDELIRLY